MTGSSGGCPGPFSPNLSLHPNSRALITQDQTWKGHVLRQPLSSLIMTCPWVSGQGEVMGQREEEPSSACFPKLPPCPFLSHFSLSTDFLKATPTLTLKP